MTFEQCGISDLFHKSDNPECKNWTKQIDIETLSILDVSKDSTYKNQVIIIPKFRALFIKKMRKSIRRKFLIPVLTCITNHKQKGLI